VVGILSAVPEGDTIYRTATALRAALLGKPLVSFDAPRLRGLMPGPAAVVERVASHGKHIEIGFDDGVVLHTHLRMTGSWHLYRTGEHWRRGINQARVVLEVAGWKAVCFNAPVVELYRSREASRHPGLGSLGPDLIRADADILECVARIERLSVEGTTVAELLLDQRIACGVGNVFKCEVLWAVELHPATRIEALSVDQRFRLIERAAEMLRANAERVERVTLPGAAGGLAVYGRTGKPCLRCGQPVQVRRHGEQARVTYFCSHCQLLLGATPAATTVKVEPAAPEAEPAEASRHPEDRVLRPARRPRRERAAAPRPDDRVVVRAPTRYVDPLLARRAASR
jgi:endonuclease VIII